MFPTRFLSFSSTPFPILTGPAERKIFQGCMETVYRVRNHSWTDNNLDGKQIECLHTMPLSNHTRPDHTIQYHTIPYYAIPYHTIPYTVPYRTVYCTVPYHTISYKHAKPHHSILHHPTSNQTIPYHTYDDLIKCPRTNLCFNPIYRQFSANLLFFH